MNNAHGGFFEVEYIQIEPNTAACWIQIGTIWEVDRGEENTYYTDEFDHRIFSKNLDS